MPKRLGMTFMVLVGILACSAGTEPQGCDVCTTGAIVYGRILAPGGAPVAAARVAVDLRTGSCASGSVGSVGASASSDALGGYRLIALSPVSPAAACTIVTATPPVSAGAAVTADTGRLVRLQNTYPANSPLDSIRVDIALRPLP